MRTSESHIAELLLQIKAIKLNPSTPFTWASGWKSPIYCDNRKTLSYPQVRNAIRDHFKDVIRKKYPEADGIAGVATGAVAHGMLVADVLDLPFIYIRSSAKGHGMQNLIEGEHQVGKKYVVIEDLVSTGGSSLKAVDALREAGCEVLGMVAIFTYGFQLAVDKFNEKNCTLDTLSNYEALIEQALASNYIQSADVEVLKEWRLSPDTWKQ
jgi:orotate phosphoribosyltransferase